MLLFLLRFHTKMDTTNAFADKCRENYTLLEETNNSPCSVLNVNFYNSKKIIIYSRLI